MKAKSYKLTFTRRGIMFTEVFIGNKFELMLYKFKMRKWHITVN
jgi:hypothetical protein